MDEYDEDLDGVDDPVTGPVEQQFLPASAVNASQQGYSLPEGLTREPTWKERRGR